MQSVYEYMCTCILIVTSLIEILELTYAARVGDEVIADRLESMNFWEGAWASRGPVGLTFGTIITSCGGRKLFVNSRWCLESSAFDPLGHVTLRHLMSHGQLPTSLASRLHIGSHFITFMRHSSYTDNVWQATRARNNLSASLSCQSNIL